MADVLTTSGGQEDYKSLDFTASRNHREFNDFFTDRRGINNPAYAGFNYIFFTAPELGLTSTRFSQASNGSALINNNGKFLKLPGFGDSIYTDEIVKMLSGDAGNFMKLFTNRAYGIPASSEVLDTVDYAETWNKYKIPIGTSAKDSKISGNFEMPFREDSFLTIIKTAKLWSNNIEGLFLGDVVSPYATYREMGSTQSSIIDYMCSVYVFTTRPDGKTLAYWSKYTGVFPTKIPYDLFQTEDGDIKVIGTVPIDFQFAYKEDMDISILRDFNLVSSNGQITNPTGNYFDSNSVSIAGIANYPGIAKTKGTIDGRTLYELRLQDPNSIDDEKQNF